MIFLFPAAFWGEKVGQKQKSKILGAASPKIALPRNSKVRLKLHDFFAHAVGAGLFWRSTCMLIKQSGMMQIKNREVKEVLSCFGAERFSGRA